MSLPVQGLMAKAEIKNFQQIKPKHCRQLTRATTDLATRYTLRGEGLEFGRDYSTIYVASEAGRLAALDAGIVDAAMVSVPENILARQKGFNELPFPGDYIEFPQNGFGASIKKIKDNTDRFTGWCAAPCAD